MIADDGCPGCTCCDVATHHKATTALWWKRLADLAGVPSDSPAQIVAALTAEMRHGRDARDLAAWYRNAVADPQGRAGFNAILAALAEPTNIRTTWNEAA